MNLIERLGGYEKAKEILDNCPQYYHEYQPLDHGIYEIGYYRDAAFNRISMISLHKTLLDYRREKNIFEDGDKVVLCYTNYRKDVFEITRLLKQTYDEKGIAYRHATDAEIEAGRRL